MCSSTNLCRTEIQSPPPRWASNTLHATLPRNTPSLVPTMPVTESSTPSSAKLQPERRSMPYKFVDSKLSFMSNLPTASLHLPLVSRSSRHPRSTASKKSVSTPAAAFQHNFQGVFTSDRPSGLPEQQRIAGQAKNRTQTIPNKQQGVRYNPTINANASGVAIINLDKNDEDVSTDPFATEPEAILLRQAAIIDLTIDRSQIIQWGDYLPDKQYEVWFREQAPPSTRENSLQPPILPRQRLASVTPPRNRPFGYPLLEINEYDHGGIMLRAKVNVELDDGDFMRILHVFRDFSTSEVRLRGWLFRRTKHMNAVLEKKLNEVCWILHTDDDDARDAKLQGLEETSVTNVVKRRGIKMTNLPFPELSHRSDLVENEQIIYNERVLVCRWKYVCSYRTARARLKNVWSERALLCLRQEECDGSCGVDGESLRQTFRDRTVKGGACFGASPAEETHLQRERTIRENAVVRSEPTGQSASTLSNSMTDSVRYGSSNTSSAGPVSSLRSDSIPSITEFEWNPTSSVVKDWLADSGSREDPKDSSRIRQTAPSTGKRKTISKIDLTGDDDPSAEFGLLSMDECSDHTSSRTPITHQQPGLFRKRRTGSADFMEVDARLQVKSRKGVFEQKWHITTQHSYQDQRAAPAKRQRTTNPTQNASRHGKPGRLPLIPNRGSLAPSQLSSEGIIGRERSPSVVVLEKPPTPNPKGKPSSTNRSQHGHAKSWNEVDLSATTRLGRESPETSTFGQRYVFGDGFCGAGGTSRGAVMAGLHVDWGFDNNEHACNSWKLNFPYAKTHCLWAHELATHRTMNPTVDVLHLSPPCQFFSPAHTTAGKNDEQNTASSFAITYLLKKTKPRIVTIENTSGLVSRHVIYMNAVVNLFTSIGFSIRWKILNFADFGVPQRRYRLVVMASWYTSLSQLHCLNFS